MWDVQINTLNQIQSVVEFHWH